jgi:cysteine desulfurase
MIYLDAAATTRPLPEAIHTFSTISADNFFNPSAVYAKASDTQKIIEKSRQTIAGSLSCSSSCIYFTSGATESNNIIINGLRSKYKKRHTILCSAGEHASVFEPAILKDAIFYKLPQDRPIDIDDIEPHINQYVKLICLTHINNETGTIINIKEITSALKRRHPDVHIHIDAVQSYMKLNIDLNDIPADSLSASAHKCHGLKGTGILYIREPTYVSPLIYGGGQEHNMRSGTENTGGIAAMGTAVSVLSSQVESNYTHAEQIKSNLLDELKTNCIDFIQFSEDHTQISPYICNVSIPGIKGEVMIRILGDEGICITNASACATRKKNKNRVLEAYGKNKQYIEGALRFSFSIFTTPEDINTAVNSIKKALSYFKRKNT